MSKGDIDRLDQDVIIFLRKCKAVSYNLHAVRTQYFDMFVKMIQENTWDDYKLMEANEECILSRHYPSMIKCIVSEEMPIVNGVVWAKHFGSETSNKNQSTRLVETMSYIISKSVMHNKCMIRNFAEVTCRPSATFPVILKFVRQMFILTFIGSYMTSYIRPSFCKALFYYVQFQEQVTFDEDIEKFLLEYPYIVFFVFREFLFYNMECSMMDDYIESITSGDSWDKLKAASRDACDYIRLTIEKKINIYGNKDINERIDYLKIMEEMHNNIQKEIHDNTRKFFSASNVGFENVIHEFMKAVFISKQGKPEDMVLSEYFDMQTFKECIEICSIQQSICRKIDLSWLSILGVSDYVYNVFRRWCFDFEVYYEAPHSYKREIEKLWSYSKKDFVICFFFFQELITKRKKWTMNLSYEIATRQIEAVRNKMGLELTDPTPEFIGKGYYCRKHDMWMQPVIKPYYQQNDPSVMYESFLTKSVFNFETHKICCIGSKTVDNDDNIIQSAVSTSVLSGSNVSDKSCNEELEEYDMLGKLVCINGVPWCLCSVCGSMMEYDNSKVFTHAISCLNHGEHIHNVEKFGTPAPVRYDVYKFGMMPFCVQTKCYFCGDLLSKKRHASKYKVLKMMNDDMRIVYLNVCLADCQLIYNNSHLINGDLKKAVIIVNSKKPKTRVKQIMANL